MKKSTNKLLYILLVLWIGSACSLGALQPPTGQAPVATATPLSTAIPHTGPPGSLPSMAVKPQPKEIDFQGCPPEGDGGDPQLNRLKNRVDEGDYVPVAFNAILDLTWPTGTERRDISEWSTADKADIARYEGIPVSVEGYIAEAREQGPESTNCHGADSSLRDWHIWLIANAGESRAHSIVVETTPRVRVNHSSWTLSRLNQIASQQEKVRISGWLMFDPEHPDQLDKTRGTLWEVHPIMKIEVEQNGKWVSLDNP